jgi:cell division septal protein FtsQ
MYIESLEIKNSGQLTYVSKEDIENLLVDNIGRRLYNINLDKQESRVTSNLIFVKTADIKKTFPSKLEIKLVERNPLLVLKTEVVEIVKDNEGQSIEKKVAKRFLISQDMMVLTDCSGKEYKALCDGLPQISLKKGICTPKLYQSVSCESIKAIQEIEIFLNEKEIESESYLIPQDDLTIVKLNDKTRVIFPAEKVVESELENFLNTREKLLMEDKSYKEIDMRYERPIVRVDKYTVWMPE